MIIIINDHFEDSTYMYDISFSKLSILLSHSPFTTTCTDSDMASVTLQGSS